MTIISNRTPLEAVQDLYRAFESRDVAAAIACFSEDVEIVQSDDLPWGGTHRGHAGAVEFFTSLTSHITTSVDVSRLLVAGDTVVENGRTQGSAVESGRGFSIPETHVFKVRGGKISRMEAYVDNAAMLRAIGA